jgi:hypothetical protein
MMALSVWPQDINSTLLASGGIRKCIFSSRSGCYTALAISTAGYDDEFVARTVSSSASLSTAASSGRLIARSNSAALRSQQPTDQRAVRVAFTLLEQKLNAMLDRGLGGISHLTLMRIRSAVGDYDGVITTFAQCEKALRAAGITPAPSTRTLLNQLRR